MDLFTLNCYLLLLLFELVDCLGVIAINIRAFHTAVLN